MNHQDTIEESLEFELLCLKANINHLEAENKLLRTIIECSSEVKIDVDRLMDLMDETA